MPLTLLTVNVEELATPVPVVVVLVVCVNVNASVAVGIPLFNGLESVKEPFCGL